MPKPRLSVLCYYFNEAKYLRAMIQSALDAMDMCDSQTELLMLDNASTDDSRAIAHSFTDPRIKFVDSDVSLSGPEFDFAAENTAGFEACSGDIVAIVGGDDLVAPDRLRLTLEAFDADPKLDVFHSGAKHINADSDELPTRFNSASYHEWNFLRVMFTYLQVAYPTTAIKRQSLLDLGGFKGGYAPDFWLWLETARKWRYRYLDEQLLWYRVHDRSASHSPDGAKRCHDATIKIRADARARYSIDDFFPEILLCQDQRLARCAAHIELGNMMLGGGMADIQLAFDEYRKANDLWPDHPAIVYNCGIIQALDGQIEQAMTCFNSLPESAMVSSAKATAQGLIPKPFTYSDGRGICPELYQVKLPAGLWKSDGTETT